MQYRFRQDLVPLLVAIFFAIPFLFWGLTWGLPSKENDLFLFGDRKPWTGAEIVGLAGGWSGNEKQGADVQRDARLDRSRQIVLNDTDAKRADIVRRYRLYTYQPDEMINLRAFSQMKPSSFEFDPKLYQYGGCWFYPCGVALKASEIIGYLEKGDVAYYMDHPEAIGRAYVVLRSVVAGWALVGVVGMYVLARLMGLRPWVAVMMGVAFASMPGVVVFGHEAKPHLPGVVWVIWAVVFGVRYVTHGGWWIWWSAVGAGVATGMVVSMLPAVLIPIMAVFCRKGLAWGWVFAVVGVCVCVSGAGYPYLFINLVRNSGVVFSQLGNSTAMYGVGGSGWGGVGGLFVMLISLTPAVLLVVPVGVLVWKHRKWPLAGGVMGPFALVLFGIFMGLGAGKPGEFARFGLGLGVFGLICAGYLSTRFIRPWTLPAVVIGLHLMLSMGELGAYMSDTGPERTRLLDAVGLRKVGLAELGIFAEPGPYNTPPVDLWKTRLVLLPQRGKELTEQVLLQPPVSDGYWRMSWAGRSTVLRTESVPSGVDKLK